MKYLSLKIYTLAKISQIGGTPIWYPSIFQGGFSLYRYCSFVSTDCNAMGHFQWPEFGSTCLSSFLKWFFLEILPLNDKLFCYTVAVSQNVKRNVNSNVNTRQFSGVGALKTFCYCEVDPVDQTTPDTRTTITSLFVPAANPQNAFLIMLVILPPYKEKWQCHVATWNRHIFNALSWASLVSQGPCLCKLKLGLQRNVSCVIWTQVRRSCRLRGRRRMKAEVYLLGSHHRLWWS